MNINSVMNTVSQSISQTQKNQKTNTDYETRVGEIENEAEELEAFKKEVWKEIDSMPWDSRMNISIQISDKAFERMMKDEDFKKDMIKIIREESIAAQPPGDVSLTWIDENGYKGYSYIGIEAGHTAFSTHSKDKDSFYVKKKKNQDNLKDYWKNEQLKKIQQEEVSNRKYEDTLYKRKLSQRDVVAKIYEDKTIKSSIVGINEAMKVK